MPSVPWRLLHVFALTTMAITQPLLGILGDNPTFFTAHDSSAGEVIWFAVVVATLPAMMLGAVEVGAHLIDERAGIRVHGGLFAVLGFLFFIQVVDVLPGHWVLVATAAGGLAWIALESYRRYAPVRAVVSLLGAMPLVFIGIFLLVSPASSVVFPDDVYAVDIEELIDEGDLVDDEAPLQDRINTRFPPIYVLVFDELPMASLLDENGEIDAYRWPNFARLADTSHLFSNTTTVGFTTETAIPAILASTYQAEAAPVYSLYPENLFTLLGDIYDVSSKDPLIDLCPPSICNNAPPEAITDLLESKGEGLPSSRSTTGAAAPRADEGTSFRLLLDDAAVVFGHLAAPGGLDIGLPSIGSGWGNFGGDLGGAVASGPAPIDEATLPSTTSPSVPGAGGVSLTDALTVDAEAINQNNVELLKGLLVDDSRVADFRADVREISGSPVPRLHVLHVLLPHLPWRLHGNGQLYNDARLPGYFSKWNDDIVAARAGQQRHLLQLRFTDRLLGEYLDELQAEGIFDDATVVVTADHGISFVPGFRSRGVGDANLGGIAGIPLFYKLPSQSISERHHGPVESIDIVPTIMNQLELEIPWEVDGHDLFGPQITRDRAVLHPFAESIPEPYQAAMDAVTQDLLATFGNGTDGSLYALAGLRELIGQPINGLIDDATNDCWIREQPTAIPDADRATGYVLGEIRTWRLETIDFAIAVDRVLTGTARTINDDVLQRVFALADPRYWGDATLANLELFEIADGRLRPITIC